MSCKIMENYCAVNKYFNYLHTLLNVAQIIKRSVEPVVQYLLNCRQAQTAGNDFQWAADFLLLTSAASLYLSLIQWQ